jgi:predicted nucleic-acid-binding protein
MIYFDTDVIVNFFIKQPKAPHLYPVAVAAVERASETGLLFISVHSLNELVFALAKCGLNRDAISEKAKSL